MYIFILFFKDVRLGGFVLQIKGFMPLQGLTIRRKFIKRAKLTDDEKQTLVNRLKKSK